MMPLKWPEYAKIKISHIPEEVIDEYNLHEETTIDGYIYIYQNRKRNVWPTTSWFTWT